VNEFCANASGREIPTIAADEDAAYERTIRVDVSGLPALVSRPGHPEDVVEVREVAGTKIGSAFIGSCTNGRFEDMAVAAEILRGRRIAPGVVLKIVPATDRVWRRCLDEGVLQIFKEAGALVGNAGCAGCAAGQIGQNGPEEVTVSTGNRNFPGKQGKGDVYLASPAVAAASAIAGVIATPESIPATPVLFAVGGGASGGRAAGRRVKAADESSRPTKVRGRVWVVAQDNIDTDMIYHNRHLAVTDITEMGQYAFGNLSGWEDFSSKARPGDIVVAGKNFGCGSSRQQAVDCFESLGIALLVAESFGAIYERNAINKGFPILVADLVHAGLKDGDEIEVDLDTGRVALPSGERIAGQPFSPVQMEIYQRGGLLANA
jgi:3-isopropylmalate dehydratase small subunit